MFSRWSLILRRRDLSVSARHTAQIDSLRKGFREGRWVAGVPWGLATDSALRLRASDSGLWRAAFVVEVWKGVVAEARADSERENLKQQGYQRHYF